MSYLFRSRFSVAAVIFALTVAACCSPSQPPDACAALSEEMSQPAASADMEMGMDGMDGVGMLSPETKACPLSVLTENDPAPPLYSAIGSAHWYVPGGQDYFDQGLRFYFGFNNREAYRAFRKAAAEAEDKGISCAACYWAQALVLGVDLNMSKELPLDRKTANEALHRALDASPSPEDRAITYALFERYQNCNPNEQDDAEERKCQKIRNRAYYDGMKSVLERFGRDDPNVVTLFADAAMNLTPWGYWYQDGKPVVTFSAQITEARDELERALKFVQRPRNEGPIHWYIHLMEQSPWPDAAKQYADWLGPLAPNSGHLVHMPSHIYYRMGDMQDAITANKKAVEADERYFAQEPDLYRPDGDRYKYGYYPHNIHFVIDAAALTGDKDDVNRYAEKLLQSAPDKANGLRADLYRAVYYLTRLNFSSTADIRRFVEPNPFEAQPLANVAYDFAQLMADIWEGQDFQQSAGKFDTDLARYRKATDRSNPTCNIYAPQRPPDLCLAAILDNLRHARTAAATKNWSDALDAAESARKMQDTLRYDEPSLWPYPVRQTEASILIRKADADGPTTPAGRDDLAEAKLRLLESLNKAPTDDSSQMPTGKYPGNGWAYYGLWEIAKRDGSLPADVAKARAELDARWLGTAEFQTLDRL